MKTPIADPILYKGWTIKLYLESFGFSFQVLAPDYLPLGPIEDGWIYASTTEACLAAKRLIKLERAALSLEGWLLEAYGADKISLEEYESLQISIRDVYVEGGKH